MVLIYSYPIVFEIYIFWIWCAKYAPVGLLHIFAVAIKISPGKGTNFIITMKKLAVILIMIFTATESFTQTSIVVRAKAKDAKFIGSSIGGAKVVIKDAVTGKILDEGFTSGSTGNTETIMKKPHERHARLTDDATAKFEGNINIETPQFVEINVYAPYNKKQAAVKASIQLWVIPGEDITGDGIIIEIPGLIVDVLSPQTHESLKNPSGIDITANVVMMCGCTISKGGLWDADKFTVKAIIRKDGTFYKTIPLNITEKDNTFATIFPQPEPGLYEIIIYAFHKENGNSGVDKVNIIIK